MLEALTNWSIVSEKKRKHTFKLGKCFFQHYNRDQTWKKENHFPSGKGCLIDHSTLVVMSINHCAIFHFSTPSTEERKQASLNVCILTHTFTLTVILISDVIYSSVSNSNPYHSLFTYQNTKSFFFPFALLTAVWKIWCECSSGGRACSFTHPISSVSEMTQSPREISFSDKQKQAHQNERNPRNPFFGFDKQILRQVWEHYEWTMEVNRWNHLDFQTNICFIREEEEE